MEQIKDGWHKLYDYEVYVENGIVKHGTKYDIHRGYTTVYPYRWYKEYNAWGRWQVKYSTLRNGIKKGNWKLS